MAETRTRWSNKTDKPSLPLQNRGRAVFVESLQDQERAQQGLAHKDSIIEIVGDQRELKQAVRWCQAQGVTAFDLETGKVGTADLKYGLDPFNDDIILCQIGNTERQYLIWYQTIDPAPLLELLRDKNTCKVGVNLKFDLRFMLAKHGKAARAWNVADTQLIEQITSCGLLGFSVGHTMKMTGMEQLADRWCGFKIPKDLDIRTGWGALTPGDWSTCPAGKGEARRYYAADDAVHPIRILEKQKPWIKKLDLVRTVLMEMQFLPVLAENEVRGMVLDWDKWESLAKEAEQELKKARRELDELFDVRVTVEITREGKATYTRDKNYGSSEQKRDLIREYMWENYGVDVVCNNNHLKESLRRSSFNEEALERMFKKEMVPNPDKPGSKMQKGYPNMTDYIDKYWEDYRTYLPKEALHLADSESDTLKLMKIIWETPISERDPDLPNLIGLPPELVDPLLRLSEYSTKIQRYAWSWESMIHPTTGRIHTDFTQCATNTGRMSSSPNFQNLPADPRFRECIVAGEGMVFVGSDWSQIEPRIIAEMSNDPTYMRVFWSGFPGTKGYDFWCEDLPEEELDLYATVGAQVGVLPAHVQTKGAVKALGDEGDKGRKQAKVVVLGLGYGTGKPKFWLQLIVQTGEHHSKEYSDSLYDGFFSAVPYVKQTLDHLSDLASPKDSKRKVWHPAAEDRVAWAETLGGRKRFVHPGNKSYWTEGRNAPVQGTGADIMKAAAIVFTHWLWENDIDGSIVVYAHDEFLVEVEKGRADEAAKKLEGVMAKVGQKFCPHVPITAEGYIETFWVKD